MNDSYTKDRKCRVLLVDDNTSHIVLLARILSTHGMDYDIIFDFDFASIGQVALEKLQESNYDLIIVDMCMPYMYGSELARRVREIGHKLPIFLCSWIMNISDGVVRVYGNENVIEADVSLFDDVLDWYDYDEIVIKIQGFLKAFSQSLESV